MAVFPRIDRPCPLDAAQRRDVAGGHCGHCGHCGKTVHDLDGMSDPERVQFMRKANGPVCISYSLTAAALALSMAGPAIATDQEGSGKAAPAAIVTAASPAQDAQATPVPIASEIKSLPAQAGTELFLGGVENPADAQWIDDDTSLPELPVRKAADPGAGQAR